jgi:hypothetical protein
MDQVDHSSSSKVFEEADDSDGGSLPGNFAAGKDWFFSGKKQETLLGISPSVPLKLELRNPNADIWCISQERTKPQQAAMGVPRLSMKLCKLE